MFLVNSRLGLFAAAPSRERPFSRSYGAILPSSLTTVRPIASVCSTGPPASVCGTGARAFETLSGFSGTAPRRGSLTCFPPGTGVCAWDFPHVRRPFGDGGVQNPAPPRRRRRRVAGRARCRNVDLPSIGCGSRLALRPRLTLGGLAFPRKPRALGGRVARPSLATRASILTSRRSTGPRRARFAAPGKLPYRCATWLHPAASAPCLAP